MNRKRKRKYLKTLRGGGLNSLTGGSQNFRDRRVAMARAQYAENGNYSKTTIVYGKLRMEVAKESFDWLCSVCRIG